MRRKQEVPIEFLSHAFVPKGYVGNFPIGFQCFKFPSTRGFRPLWNAGKNIGIRKHINLIGMQVQNKGL